MWVMHAGMIAFFLLLGAVFRSGRGAGLISGYNTASKTERDKTDEKALCRFMGLVMFALAACFGVMLLSDLMRVMWLLWAGLALFFAAAIGAVIYVNTGSRFRK